jgi:hypothetical protein
MTYRHCHSKEENWLGIEGRYKSSVIEPFKTEADKQNKIQQASNMEV